MSQILEVGRWAPGIQGKLYRRPQLGLGRANGYDQRPTRCTISVWVSITDEDGVGDDCSRSRTKIIAIHSSFSGFVESCPQLQRPIYLTPAPMMQKSHAFRTPYLCSHRDLRQEAQAIIHARPGSIKCSSTVPPSFRQSLAPHHSHSGPHHH